MLQNEVKHAMERTMRVPVSAMKFDPALARVDTAVKAIWQLYRWERWELLASLGVDREKYEPIFHQFDEEHIISDHGLLESNHVPKLLKVCGPELVARSLEILERYQMMTRESRNAYLQKREVENG